MDRKAKLKKKLMVYHGLGEWCTPSNQSFHDRFFASAIEQEFSPAEVREAMKEIRKVYDLEE